MSMLDQVNPVTGEFLVHDKPRHPHEAIEESGLWALDTGQDSYVQQSFADECDINTIVRKYQDVGALPGDDRQPIFGDFSEIPDYQDAFDIVHRASESFSALSSDVRTRFGNDPGQLMAFLADPANNDESFKLGLRQKPPPSDTDRIVAAIGAQAPQAASSSSPAT